MPQLPAPDARLLFGTWQGSRLSPSQWRPPGRSGPSTAAYHVGQPLASRLRGAAGELELAVDEAWPWLLVYSGDTLPAGQRRRSLALEPMSCPANALADGVDVVFLEPGETWAGTWTVAWTPAG